MKHILGMVVAMASEARMLVGRGPWKQVKEHLVRQVRLNDGTDLIVARTGVGVENALVSAHLLISMGATALISIGLAGGLSPGLKAGHLIVADNILHNDNEKIQGPWQTDATGVAHCLATFAAERVPVTCGAVVTVPQGILTIDHKKLLFRQTLALAVDMESAAIARVAQEKNLPFFSMRAICDPAHEDVPRELYDCLDKNGKVRLAAVLFNIARRPSLVLDMQRMGRHFAAARKALKGGWRLQTRNSLPRLLVSRSQNDAM